MNATDIKDYVVKYVIQYLKDRDQELNELRKELSMVKEMAADECDIIKCDSCSKYRKVWEKCDICDVVICEDCINDNKVITHVQTWNLSGTWMCSKCITEYCHFCANIGYMGCSQCRDISCERCAKLSRGTCKHIVLPEHHA